MKMKKTKLLRVALTFLCMGIASQAFAGRVTLSADNKTMGGSGNVTVSLGGSAYLSSNRIKLPKSAASTFTVATKDGSAIRQIAFTWTKQPQSGFSVNTGSVSTTSWTGNSSSVKFSSNGSSEIQLQQMTVTYGGSTSATSTNNTTTSTNSSSNYYTVTLSYANGELAGTKDFTIKEAGSAYLNGNKIYMPQGSSSSFTVTYNWTDKVIKEIDFTNSQSPSTGTFSANYGSFQSYPKVWIAPDGGMKSVRFSSNGKSIALIKEMKIILVDNNGSTSSNTDTNSGSSTGSQSSGSTSTATGLSKYDLNKPIGWATVGGTVTGSSNKNAITVTNINDFLSAMTGSDQKTIYIKGTITVNGKVTVKDCSNKTVYGLPGSSFSNLKHSSNVDESGILSMSRCSNIILRNLTFKGAGAYDIDGNDNLTLQTCDYIWVDHCDFQDGVDGNFDANNGSDHLAVTWCRFRYLIKPYAGGSGGSDDHRNTNLWGGSDSSTKDAGKLRTTFANCWWDEGCHERNPRVRFGQVHVVNCYYSYEGNNYCIGAGYKSNIYADYNNFDNVNKPWACYATKSGKTDYNITMKNNIGQSDIQQRSGSNAYFNPYSVYSYSPYAASEVKTQVSGHAGATLNISEGGGVNAKGVAISDSETTGIEDTESIESTKVVKTDIFAINGARLNDVQKGVNIIKTTYADGTVKTKKIVIR